jgi:hypothetical protein
MSATAVSPPHHARVPGTGAPCLHKLEGQAGENEADAARDQHGVRLPQQHRVEPP